MFTKYEFLFKCDFKTIWIVIYYAFTKYLDSYFCLSIPLVNIKIFCVKEREYHLTEIPSYLQGILLMD